MSFPSAFSSQLAAIMEALLKAVVTEVTALVEDGAVELRLELRDRERQILEKERDIEERDRVIEELRAAVEELTAREEAAAVRAAEEREEEERESQQEWTKAEEDTETKPVVKSEPVEDFTAASSNLQESLWPPPPLCSTSTEPAPACSYDQNLSFNSQEDAEDFPHLGHTDLPLDSLLSMNQENFYSTQQHGFSLLPNCSRGVKKKSLTVKRAKLPRFKCDQCGKTFTEKRRLATHQSVHTGAKPYNCKKCGMKFSRRDNCVRHEKSDSCKDSRLIQVKPGDAHRVMGQMQRTNFPTVTISSP